MQLKQTDIILYEDTFDANLVWHFLNHNNKYQYTVVPPDDGPRYAWNM